MKAYHITRAQSPSELPDWLFDERERQVANRSSGSDDSLVRSQLPLQNERKQTASSEQLKSSLVEQVPTQSQLRGTDRLKAMRETKQQRIQERDALKFKASYIQQTNVSTYLP